MKKVLSASLVLSLLGLSSAAFAQDAANPDAGFYAGAAYTHLDASDDDDSVSGGIATLKVGYDFNKSWAVEARAGLGEAEKTIGAAKFTVASNFAVLGKYNHELAKDFSVYAVAGVAHTQLKGKSAVASKDSSQVGASVGAGVQYKLTPNVALTAEYSWLGENDSVNFTGASAGLNYKF